jgi:hypothetical protein
MEFRITPGPPEIGRDGPCSRCSHMHVFTETGRLRTARAAWVTEQHATERYTHSDLVARNDWINGDSVIDSDGDVWVYWEDSWYARSRDHSTTECGRLYVDEDTTDRPLPNYEPFAIWHLTPRLKPPAFASVREAEAWLDANER